jgi:NAD-dependent dihydropyrimidine dehydrogenase PreA subunit/bacterioferritin-associated ferredoxin
MKIVRYQARVDESKCDGDKLCENMCPAGAIRVIDKKAVVDPDNCMACLRCEDVCPHSAVTMEKLPHPRFVGVDPAEIEKMDVTDLNALCLEAGLMADIPMCFCTWTQAKEAATAIMQGAKTPEAVTRKTGVCTGCGIYCVGSVLKLLKAQWGELDPPKSGLWVDSTVSMWDVSDEVEEKYPEFHLKEDKQVLFE